MQDVLRRIADLCLAQMLRMLTYAGRVTAHRGPVSSADAAYADVCCRMLTYAGRVAAHRGPVSSADAAYADVC